MTEKWIDQESFHVVAEIENFEAAVSKQQRRSQKRVHRHHVLGPEWRDYFFGVMSMASNSIAGRGCSLPRSSVTANVSSSILSGFRSPRLMKEWIETFPRSPEGISCSGLNTSWYSCHLLTRLAVRTSQRTSWLFTRGFNSRAVNSRTDLAD